MKILSYGWILAVMSLVVASLQAQELQTENVLLEGKTENFLFLGHYVDADTGAELHLLAGGEDVFGYLKYNDEVDHIRFGSFSDVVNGEVNLSLESDNNLEGKIRKGGSLLKLKLTDRGFNKLEKFTFELQPLEGVAGTYQITPTPKGGEIFTYNSQSGLAVSEIDESTQEVEFIFWWHHKQIDKGQGLVGRAELVDEDEKWYYFTYSSPGPLENSLNELSVDLEFKLAKNETVGVMVMKVDKNSTLRFPKEVDVALIKYEELTQQ